MKEHIFFKSPKHRERFLAAIQSIGKIYDDKVDPEYGAAVYILTSSLSTWQKTSSYVESDGIDFPKMLKRVDFSGGYVSLIKLAGNLFNDRTHVAPIELYSLDDTNFAIALTALQIRRHNWHIGAFMTNDEIVAKVEDILGEE